MGLSGQPARIFREKMNLTGWLGMILNSMPSMTRSSSFVVFSSVVMSARIVSTTRLV
jgi:hypothetical protein